jgi:hypothetical protein
VVILKKLFALPFFFLILVGASEAVTMGEFEKHIAQAKMGKSTVNVSDESYVLSVKVHTFGDAPIKTPVYLVEALFFKDESNDQTVYLSAVIYDDSSGIHEYLGWWMALSCMAAPKVELAHPIFTQTRVIETEYGNAPILSDTTGAMWEKTAKGTVLWFIDTAPEVFTDPTW